MSISIMTYNSYPANIDPCQYTTDNYLNESIYYVDMIIKSKSFDLLKDLLIDEAKSSFKVHTTGLNLKQYQYDKSMISKKEWQEAKQSYNHLLSNHKNDLIKYSKLKPYELQAMFNSDNVSVIDNNIYNLVMIYFGERHIEPLYDLRDEDNINFINSISLSSDLLGNVLGIDIRKLKPNKEYPIYISDKEALFKKLKDETQRFIITSDFKRKSADGCRREVEKIFNKFESGKYYILRT